MKKGKRTFGKILMVLTLAFFYLPILYMIIFSFNAGKSLTAFTGFSLRWYQHMLDSKDMMEALYTTFTVAIIATLISTAVGTISAIGLSKSKKILRDVMDQVNNFPMMNPEIVTAIGFMLLFITFKIEKGYATMLLAHIAFCIPYVMLSVMPKIRSLDPNLADAAMDLGATPWQALIRVIVPEITPGIISGALIAFTMSVDDFIISYFVTGGGVKNLSIVVYTMSKRINPSINAVSTLVVIIITVVLVLINVVPMLMAKRQKKDEVGRRSFVLPGCAAAAVILLICLVKIGSAGQDLPYAGQTLSVYMPGEYMGENVIPDFEKATGATVAMEYFDSNEQMYIKVANEENYDVLIPSDYMIQRLMDEGYLQKLKPELLTCMDEITDSVKHPAFDPDDAYSVSYFWGTVGIVYDKTKVSEEDLEREGFNIFKDTKYRGDIYLYDSERDSFMMALKALGYSMNTTDKSEIDQAYQWLIEQRDSMNPIYAGDDVIDNMISGNKAMAVVYSGDGAYIMSENEKLDFFEPEEGTNTWYDAMVIMKGTKHSELAHKFINFMLDNDNAAANSAEVGYTSPVTKAYEQMKSEDYKGIDAYAPNTGNEKNEVFRYQDTEIKQYFADLWTKVKAY